MAIHILGTGSHIPPQVVTNEDLSKRVETSDDWITSRTGIRERRVATADTATSDMAADAARKALADAGVAALDIDILLVATCTPDHVFPSTATVVQHAIGAVNAFAMDLSAACSGFIYGLEMARNLLESGRYKKALVIGAEKMSTIVDWDDRGTCILFGDGAGAVVLSAEAGDIGGIRACKLGSNGALGGLLHVHAGGSRHPVDAQVLAERSNTIRMSGQEVFKHAVQNMTHTALDLLSSAGWKAEDLALVIPHQANRRILEAIRTRVGVAEEKVFVNVHKYGNTSAASIGIALDEAAKQGRLHPGDRVMLLAFGAGFTWGGVLLEWRTPA